MLQAYSFAQTKKRRTPKTPIQRFRPDAHKETFIAATGGFRLESVEQFKKRQAEIRRIERQFKSGKYSERSHRRLCELKNIVFDSYELDEHPNA